MTRSFCKKNFSQCLSGIFHCYATSNKFINPNENKFLNSIYWCGFKITQDIITRYGWMDRPCSDDSTKVWHLFVGLLVLEIGILTLFIGVGLK